MTFVSNRTRLFNDRGDHVLEPRRSEARLKTYTSATDIRAWCGIVDDRRRHILELVTKGKSTCSGKLIPMEAIINALIANKNVDIESLTNELSKMWSMVESLDLSDEDRMKMSMLKPKLGKGKPLKARLDESHIEPKSSPGPKRGKRSTTRVKHVISLSQLREVGIDVDALKPSCWTKGQEGPAKIVTRVKLPKIPKESKSQCPVGLVKDAGPSDDATQDPDKRIALLQNQLAARDVICAEQQASMNKLIQERDHLQEQLNDTLLKLEHYKQISESNNASPLLPKSCEDEVKVLEAEIEVMRNGKPSPEQEAEFISKEVTMLKNYCSKLAGVEEENKKLKKEMNNLQSKVAKFDQDNADNVLTLQIKELQEKLAGLEQLTAERDILKKQVEELNTELIKYNDTPKSVDVFGDKSEILDNVLAERDSLQRRLDQMQEVEAELNELRSKAEQVDNLERELEMYDRSEKQADMEVRRSKTRCCTLERELQNVKSERDAMNKRIGCMKKENDTLKCRCKEIEMLKLERDGLQIKLNELSQIQLEYEDLLPQLNRMESIKNERDMFKAKYENLMSLECECSALRSEVQAAQNVARERDVLVQQVEQLESCICDQEEEIKSLVYQIDSLAKNRDGKQDRMRDALSSMRAEIERKDNLIAASEEKLSAVQAHLANSIKGVTCETSYLKSRCDVLEKELRQAQSNLVEKSNQVKMLQQNSREKDACICNLDKEGKYSRRKNEADTIVLMKKELDAAKAENKKLQEIAAEMMSLTGDEHAQNMMKQSECAVKRVVQELGKQYREWEKLNHGSKKYRRKFTDKHIQPVKDLGVISETESSEQLKQELEEIHLEKEKLQRYIKELQQGCPGEAAEKELSVLRTENVQLQTRLEKELQVRRDLEAKLNV